MILVFLRCAARRVAALHAGKSWLMLLLSGWCLAAAAAGAAGSAPLPGADGVVGLLQKGKQGPKTEVSAGAQLLGDIERFRRDGAKQPPEAAAQTWLKLYDRAADLGGHAQEDASAVDMLVQRPVSIASVMSALPAPHAWKALQALAAERARKHPDRYQDQVLALLAAELSSDRKSVKAQFNATDAAIRLLAPQARMLPDYYLVSARRVDTQLNGTDKDIADAVLGAVGGAGSGARRFSRWQATVEIPDLVTLVGAQRAEEILLTAITSNSAVRVASGDATRTLARAVAVKHMADLQRPQWLLVDSVDAGELYEALRARFGKDVPGADASDVTGADEARQSADVYYFLSMVIAGRQAAAEAAFGAIAAKQSFSLPQGAIDALERAHRDQALVAFLGAYLSHHPEAGAWQVYIERAAYVGHGAEALATLDAVLARTDLPAYLRSSLGMSRIRALLALDQTQPALAALHALLKAPPAKDERGLGERAQAAVQLAGLGRVLDDAKSRQTGLRFAESALALQTAGEDRWRTDVQRALIGELRRQGDAAVAYQIILAGLARTMDDGGMARRYETYGVTGMGSDRRHLLGELVGLYAAAGQYEDVRTLLKDAVGWDARDLAEIEDDKDALDVPVALSAGRSLAALGEKESARRIAEALIHHLPGNDGAYELYLSLVDDPVAFLEAQFRQDAFEERPLIWKAIFLAHGKRWTEADRVVRDAIAIDPSDGEEGPGDRMRAYVVLADILEATGDAKGAAENREVVNAIRQSEAADTLHALGLYQRAFAGYGGALQHFSDAYCIQSRLAIQLDQQGHHEEAAQHFRRAYELMPSSFGRVESHCFGCERVFRGPGPQEIATDVFTGLAKKDPRNPRVHYLLGYLLEEQERYADAVPEYRLAVQFDPQYLNAWKRLAGLREHIHLSAADSEISTFKLMELDPRQRHTSYDVGSVSDFAHLWELAAQQHDASMGETAITVYPLEHSAAAYAAAQAALPPELRAQIEKFQAIRSVMADRHAAAPPQAVLAQHALIRSIGSLLGDPGDGPE